MSNFKTLRLNEDDILSQSSDEKMDTGSESIISNTPNSVRSSDFEDRDPIENKTKPDESVLRLQGPYVDNKPTEDSLVTKMSNLYLDSPTGLKNLGKSPPRLSSLTLTISHPLMGANSPEEVYPDLIPKKKLEDEKSSLSSVEDERSNGYHFYPERNTSKNNLYFENCLADPQIVDIDTNPPDVARVQEKFERRKIIPKLTEARKPDTPRRIMNCSADSNREYCAIINEKFIKLSNHSTPRSSLDFGVPRNEELNIGVPIWCDSPSQLRSIPNFELPIELSSTICSNKGHQSPDAMSSSTQDEPSSYQALLDPYTGSVALHHSQSRCSSGQRRMIRAQLQTEEQDRCSLDSVSGCSMESEDEPPEPPEDEQDAHHSDEETKQSTNTISESSEPIPEYSAAEEFNDERSWLTVPRPEGRVKCDMKVIEPFKRVVSHGGYDACGAALVVFSACHLPDSARPDYRYVMDNLFLYVIWTLERLITDEYVLVYLHGSAGRRKLPTFHWLHECYKLIDRRLRKSLKHLYLVHPTFWLRSFVVLSKPFVSSKFFRKLSYVRCLSELFEKVPLEPNAVPEQVKAYDAGR